MRDAKRIANVIKYQHNSSMQQHLNPNSFQMAQIAIRPKSPVSPYFPKIYHQSTRICPIHRHQIVGICTSPYCDNYRELCKECKLFHTHPEFKEWNQALEEAKKMIKNGIDQLEVTRLRKNADVENYLRNNVVLFQIENSLREIEILITEKIEEFKKSVNNIYAEHVKEKLQDLDDIIAKSNKTLHNTLKSLNEKPDQNLAHIFNRDLLYQVKYFDSYFNQIFIKKTRNFRTALQHDRILTLIVNFQQNLKRIFTFNIQKTGNDYRQYHLFRQQSQSTMLYTLSKDTHKIQKKQLPNISSLVNFTQKYDYEWQGIPQSLFYKPNNCYYIIGEGRKTSKAIVKWECSKPVEDSFYALRSMETQRRQFGVCELEGQIYIVGGENEKDGCLARCQKFVPQYSSQIYIIHSLNVRSSRHSLTTYKNKYILKFGGIRKMCPPGAHPINLQQIAAPPEIYSVQSEQWSVIPVKKDMQIKFGIYPSIFRAQNKNLLLILGGQLSGEQKVTFSILIQDNKEAVKQLRMRTHKSRLHHRGVIFNSTIKVDQEQNLCTFMNSTDENQSIGLAKIKLYNWYH